MLGSIGGVLLLLSSIPYVGITLGIAGLVLVLIAVKYISDIVKDPRIFNNAIIAVEAGILGIVIYLFLGIVIFSSIVTPALAGLPPNLIAIIALIVGWVTSIASGGFCKA